MSDMQKFLELQQRFRDELCMNLGLSSELLGKSENKTQPVIRGTTVWKEHKLDNGIVIEWLESGEVRVSISSDNQ